MTKKSCENWQGPITWKAFTELPPPQGKQPAAPVAPAVEGKQDYNPIFSLRQECERLRAENAANISLESKYIHLRELCLEVLRIIKDLEDNNIFPRKAIADWRQRLKDEGIVNTVGMGERSFKEWPENAEALRPAPAGTQKPLVGSLDSGKE